MKNKLILPITILLLFTLFSIPASALSINPISEVETITNVEFHFDDDVKISKGKSQIYNNVLHNSLIPYEYKLVNKELISENLPTPYDLGVEKKGYSFSGWKFSVDTNKTVHHAGQSSALSVFPLTQEIDTIAEAQWKRNTLDVYYNVNYGTMSQKAESPKYAINEYGNVVYKNNQLFKQTFTYGIKTKNGLVNAETFNLERDGYVFVGWSTYKNGKALLNPNVAVSAENITKNVLNGNTKITLYAQWIPKTVNVVYSLNNDTEVITNSKYNTENGVIRLKDDDTIYSQKYSINKTPYITLDENIFEITKPFSEFIGWAVEPNSNKVVFKAGDKLNYKKIVPLLTEDGKVLRLYPVWESYSFPLDKSSGIFISSLQGYRVHPVYHEERYHSGLDIAAGYGTSIYAVEGGTVVAVGIDRGVGYGNYVKIDHGNGITTLYAHASSVLVKEGQKVEKGDIIAKVGSTGTSTGNHLHLEIKINGELKDPMDYIDFTDVPIDI